MLKDKEGRRFVAKRFTDTQIWEKEWFMALSPKLKCLWRYLTERCDQSGVWEVNWALASLYIGEQVASQDLKKFGDHVEILPNGKVFIPDFINFQYGALSEKSPAHKPVFRAISKNNLNNRVFNRVFNTLQEKEEEKDKEEVKEVEKEKEGPAEFSDYEKWTEDAISGNDWLLADKIKNMGIQVNGSMEAYARSHLAMLAKYPKMQPTDQNRFRLSLIGHIQEKLGDRPKGKKELTIDDIK